MHQKLILLFIGCLVSASLLAQTDSMIIEHTESVSTQYDVKTFAELTHLDFGNGKVVYQLTQSSGRIFKTTDVTKIVFESPEWVVAPLDQTVCSNKLNVGTTKINLNATLVRSLPDTRVSWTIIPNQSSGIVNSPGTLFSEYIPDAQDIERGYAKIRVATVRELSADTVTLFFTDNFLPDAGPDINFCKDQVASVSFLIGAPKGYTDGFTWRPGHPNGSFFPNNSGIEVTYKPSAVELLTSRTYVTVESKRNVLACPLGIDTVWINIRNCIPKTNLTFPNQATQHNGPPVQMLATSPVPGTITYELVQPSACATLSPSGILTYTCVDTIEVKARKAAVGPYPADSTTAFLFIQKTNPIVRLERRGAVASAPPFRLFTVTNYDGTLEYQIFGDTNIASIQPSGWIQPKTAGEVIVLVRAFENNNYFAASDTIHLRIYPTPLQPLALRDTIRFDVGSRVDQAIVGNDIGLTASLQLNSSYRVDLDPSTPVLDVRKNIPSVGSFIVTSDGLLTFSPFVGFLGIDSIEYVVWDETGLISAPAYIIIQANDIVEEEPLKANEAMSPNGDEQNDALVIGYTNFNRRNEIIVFDSFGETLFQKENYRNNWTGTDKADKPLPTGVYFYIFKEYNSDQSVRRSLKGYIQLVR
ncbi:MAG: gliding motility-associated C-terminal domain-containing protein [Cytophagaceae bacterium]|jgi:gliding motility-associated-like protein|nr:gliding motility-associated C-terminal domain-containing protein [Cytophagaceae bacterium]